MGMARNASSGNGKWTQRFAAFRKAVGVPGATVPGISTRGYHRSPSGSNKSGALSKGNQEWGSTSRKEEDALRGMNNRARCQHVAEGLADYEAEIMDDYLPSYDMVEWPEGELFGTDILFNGHRVDEDDEWPDSWNDTTSSQIADLMQEIEVLKARVAFLEGTDT